MAPAIALAVLVACGLPRDGENPRKPDEIVEDYEENWEETRDVILLEYFLAPWDEVALAHDLRIMGLGDAEVFGLLWIARTSGRTLREIAREHDESGGSLVTMIREHRLPIRQLFINLPEGSDVPDSLRRCYQAYWERRDDTDDSDIGWLIRMRVATDYFGISATEAFATVGSDEAYRELILEHFRQCGAGGRTVTGRQSQHGPRPWDPDTRSTWNEARERAGMGR